MPTLTASQRRAEDKSRYDAFLAGCPSRQLLDVLSDKWVTLLMVALAGGPRRFSELARDVAGVSQKMLTQTLRSLERNGMLTRSVEATVPVTVTYELTDLGRSLLGVVAQIKDWAEAHMDEVVTARATYDAS